MGHLLSEAGRGQNTEPKQASKRNLLAGKVRVWDWLGHKKKAS